MSTDQAKKNILRIVPEASHGSQASEATPSAASQNAEGDPVCPLCFGTGMEVVSGKGARRCRCRIQDRRAVSLAAARIPRRYEHCSIHNFENAGEEPSKYFALGEADR